MNYKKNVCPINEGAVVNVTLDFDRVITKERRYASWIGQSCLGDNFTPYEIELLNAITSVQGVNAHRDGHTYISGNQVVVEVIAIQQGRPVREIVNQIVKKVARRIAKGERRRCIK